MPGFWTVFGCAVLGVSLVFGAVACLILAFEVAKTRGGMIVGLVGAVACVLGFIALMAAIVTE